MAAAECSDPLREEHRRRVVVGISTATFALLLMAALYSYHPPSDENRIGLLGYMLSWAATRAIGVVAWGIPVLLALYAWDTLTQRPAPLLTALRRLGPVLGFCALVHLSTPGVLPYGQPAGGLLGEFVGECLRSLLGIWGVALFGAAALLCLALLRCRPEPAEEGSTETAAPEGARAQLPEPSYALAPAQSSILARSDEGAALLTALADLGITGRLQAVHRGPVVTTYEFALGPGIRVSKIAGCGDELAVRLGRPTRIVAPIPGKACVGFELANAERQTVALRPLLENRRWSAHKAALPLALGVSPTGEPVYVDLASMPHLLVAGTTGAGKSMGVHAMLVSLLMRCSPAELRLVLIDPKMAEFSNYRDIPHLAAKVVTDMSQARSALSWVVEEMERRCALFAESGDRDLDSYHARSSDARLARIVVVVDELAELLVLAGKDVEGLLMRLAQRARAAGIHLLLATQRPSADVIAGLLKANIPTRIAYKVCSREDSRTILGRSGAEDLLGKGDLLLLRPEGLMRVHGAHVSVSELKELCGRLRARAKPAYEIDLDDAARDLAPTAPAERSSVRPLQLLRPAEDEHYERACALVVEEGYCSISQLQRAFGIGYNKAARLVERMEKAGLVGPPPHAQGGRRTVVGELDP